VYPIRGAKDYSCGFRAYRVGLLRQAFTRWGDRFISERGFSCMVDILIKLSLLDAIITEVPMILRYDRKPGKSKMNVRKTVTQTLTLLVRRRLGRLD
jgi:dolichol-phosphate mannosyltransferase